MGGNNIKKLGEGQGGGGLQTTIHHPHHHPHHLISQRLPGCLLSTRFFRLSGSLCWMLRTFTPATLAAISARLETAIRPHRRRLNPVAGTRRAAVFIPLCNVHGAASVLFTVRSHAVGTHKGQVSFPGGHREGGERSHNTALRWVA
jgi:hypothetical protein